MTPYHTSHIVLTPENSIKVQRATRQLNRSANDIVNTIVANLQMLEVEQRITLTVKAAPGMPPARGRIVKKHSSTWPE